MVRLTIWLHFSVNLCNMMNRVQDNVIFIDLPSIMIGLSHADDIARPRRVAPYSCDRAERSQGQGYNRKIPKKGGLVKEVSVSEDLNFVNKNEKVWKLTEFLGRDVVFKYQFAIRTTESNFNQTFNIVYL